MKIYDPEEDNDYTDICDYCNARLVIYPSDLDGSQLISEDNSFDLVCPSCGGQIRLTMDPTIGPLPECFECGDIWLERDERKCPCDKVERPSKQESVRESWHPQCISVNPPTKMVDVTTTFDTSKQAMLMLDCDICPLFDTCRSIAEAKQKLTTPSDQISHPSHYPEGSFDNIEKIIDGLPAAKAVALANVLKYAIRAGHKEGESLEKDLGKARNYAHRLVTGKWIWEDSGSEESEYE